MNKLASCAVLTLLAQTAGAAGMNPLEESASAPASVEVTIAPSYNEESTKTLIAELNKGYRRAHPEMIQKLLNEGADVNRKNQHGETALMFAVYYQRLGMVQDVLNGGAMVDLQNNKGQTALNAAVCKNRLDIVQYLLDKNANILINNVLIDAVYQESLDMIELLLKRGANVNAQDENGRTALMVAVEKNHYNMAHFLLQSGAVDSINVQDKYGKTTLMLTLLNHHPYEIFKLLIENGADVNIKIKGLPLLIYIIDKFFRDRNIENVVYEQMLNSLLNASDINVNAMGSYKETALMLASLFRGLETVQRLLEKGARVDLQNQHGQTALDFAQEEYERIKEINKTKKKSGMMHMDEEESKLFGIIELLQQHTSKAADASVEFASAAAGGGAVFSATEDS